MTSYTPLPCRFESSCGHYDAVMCEWLAVPSGLWLFQKVLFVLFGLYVSVVPVNWNNRKLIRWARHRQLSVIFFSLSIIWNSIFRNMGQRSHNEIVIQINPCPANSDIPCLCKQWRSRSVRFWRSQLIWICTVCTWIYINNLDQVIWLAEN